MTELGLLVLSLATAGVAFVALRSRRLPITAAGLAATGAGSGALLSAIGYPGVGAAALAATWTVTAAGLVLSRLLAQVEGRDRSPGGAREPGLVALLATLFLAGALSLGVLAVDWPAAEPAPTSIAGASTDIGTAHRDTRSSEPRLAGWAFAALGVAAAVALTAIPPHAEET